MIRVGPSIAAGVNLLPFINVGFNPTLISGNRLWLDGDDSSTITHTNGRVSQWRDKSGLANHANQGNTSFQPRTGVRTLNGKNVVVSDDDSIMDCGDIGVDPQDQNLTVIAVFASDDWGSFGTVYSWGGSQLRALHNSANRLQFLANGNTNILASSGNATGTRPYISTLALDATTIDFRYDETADNSTGSVALNSSNNFNIFCNTTSSNTFSLDGYMAEIMVYDRKLTLSEIQQIETYLAAKWQIASQIDNDFVLVGSGQSNMEYHFTQGGGTAAVALENTLSSYYSGNVEFINGANSASSLIKSNAATNFTDRWYYDPVLDEFGPSYDKFVTAVTGKNVKGIIWDQGETDASAIGRFTGTYDHAKAVEYKAGLITLFEKYRELLGNVPIYIVPLGRRGGGQGVSWTSLTLMQYEVAAEMDNVFVTAPKHNYTIGDALHIEIGATRDSLATYQAHYVAKTMGRAGATPIDGPTFLDATLSGTTIDIDVGHIGAAVLDASPASGIEGFSVFDGDYPGNLNDGVGASEIAITAATRVSDTVLRLTLSSAPVSATPHVIYGYDAFDNADVANLPKDTLGFALPVTAMEL